MFEVIISQVKTGRIERKVFDSRAEAERHLAKKEDQLLSRKRPASLGDYRMEIHFREVPAIVAASQAAEGAQHRNTSHAA